MAGAPFDGGADRPGGVAGRAGARSGAVSGEIRHRLDLSDHHRIEPSEWIRDRALFGGLVQPGNLLIHLPPGPARPPRPGFPDFGGDPRPVTPPPT
jgi:hypothetical protein